MALMQMHHDILPADYVFQHIKKSVEDFEIFGSKVLLASYARPEKTKGGILLPDQIRDEEGIQGKAWLVVRMGPIPFDEEDYAYFGGKDNIPKVGDWVKIRLTNGDHVALVTTKPVGGKNQWECRLLHDRRHIDGRVKSPDQLW
jgi:co-chaperonin GroES (HSP10)